MEEENGVDFIFLFFYIFGVVFDILYGCEVFLELFLFVYYCSIVYEKFVFQKMRNPNRARTFKLHTRKNNANEYIGKQTDLLL